MVWPLRYWGVKAFPWMMQAVSVTIAFNPRRSRSTAWLLRMKWFFLSLTSHMGDKWLLLWGDLLLYMHLMGFGLGDHLILPGLRRLCDILLWPLPSAQTQLSWGGQGDRHTWAWLSLVTVGTLCWLNSSGLYCFTSVLLILHHLHIERGLFPHPLYLGLTHLHLKVQLCLGIA